MQRVHALFLLGKLVTVMTAGKSESVYRRDCTAAGSRPQSLLARTKLRDRESSRLSRRCQLLAAPQRGHAVNTGFEVSTKLTLDMKQTARRCEAFR